MENVDWGQLVTTLFGASGAAWVGFRALADWLRAREAKKIQDNYARMARIYDALRVAMASTRASRICILKTENGGGIPSPGCDVKSSVLYENAAPNSAQALQANWQKVPLNGTWCALINDVVIKGNAILTRDQEFGVENDFLSTAGCDKVIFVRVSVKRNALYYMSVHLSNEVELTKNEQVQLRACARMIQAQFENDPNLTRGDIDSE